MSLNVFIRMAILSYFILETITVINGKPIGSDSGNDAADNDAVNEAAVDDTVNEAAGNEAVIEDAVDDTGTEIQNPDESSSSDELCADAFFNSPVNDTENEAGIQAVGSDSENDAAVDDTGTVILGGNIFKKNPEEPRISEELLGGIFFKTPEGLSSSEEGTSFAAMQIESAGNSSSAMQIEPAAEVSSSGCGSKCCGSKCSGCSICNIL